MDNRHYIISKKDLFDLFGRLAQKDLRVVVPYRNGERFNFADFDSKKQDLIDLGGVRQSQPLKSFLNSSREDMIKAEGRNSRPLVLAGLKGCDLSSLILQDFVFLQGDCEDPFYAKNRTNTILIGSDCTYAQETCFCLAVDGAPYPKKYFDINLSSVEDHFMVEAGSKKGETLIEDFKTFFREAGRADNAARQANRDKVSGQIKDFIAKRGTKDTVRIKGAVEKSYNRTEMWQDFSSTCVECGACNFVCPTCHCFLLFDDKHGPDTGRYRIWDSCLYKTFARVAGGANPRRHLYERLRNRFDKKFAFFPKVLDYFACTGCGRCIEACPGNIDIREVLKGLVDGKWSKPPHE